MALKRLRCFDCASLRPATRKFSASSYTSYTPSPPTPAFPYSAPVPHRAVIRVAGKDATKFLNGLAAVKIPETIEGSRSFYGSFLHAQGRILHDTFIHLCPTSNAFLIEYDVRSPTSFLESIKKFVLRSKVGLKDVSSEWDVWAAWGHQDALERAKGGQRAWKWGNGASAALNWETEPERLSDPSENETGGWDLRAPGMGWRGLVKKGKTPSLAETGSSCQATDAYTLHRIMRGVPEGVDDLVPMSSLPSESCLDFMGGVDFRKGCYVGQELTVRTYHTGVIRKRIMPVQLFPLDKSPPSDLTPLPGSFPHPLPTALDIRLNSLPTSDTPDTKPSRGRSSGRLLSNVQGIGLALLRLEQVQTVWRGEGSMSVVDSEGNTFGVKPFKVDWWPVENPEEGQEVKRSV